VRPQPFRTPIVTRPVWTAVPPSNAPSPEMTLPEFFERYFWPVYLRSTMADPKTVAEYRSAVRRWQTLIGAMPMRAIDNLTCAAFVAKDLQRKSGKRPGETLSPNSVRKHCTHLQMVLSLAGPQSKEHPQAASPYGLFGTDPFGRPRPVPWFVKPPERDKLPEDGFTIEEIGLILTACEGAIKPVLADCSAATWWKCLCLAAYNTGIRIGSMVALRRAWITRQIDDGWVSIPALAYKKKRPKVIYLPPEALAAIDAMPTGDLIWPWPESPVSLQRYRRTLLSAAGIPPARWFGFHGLRKAIGTQLWAIDQKAAQLQLGHEDAATTRKSYVNPAAIGASLAATIGPAMRRVRQPKASMPDPQKLLF
jgi:integrase